MTLEIGLALAVLVAVIALLAGDWLRADLVAIATMIALPSLGLISSSDALSGLSSNAVVAIAAVMVLGYGVDRAGLTRSLARPVLGWAGDSERRLVIALMLAAGLMSAFMPNIGAAALFLPVAARISRRGGIPASRLLIPMGFATILGGTVSMIGSGPLIVLNDLLEQAELRRFGLFDVAPMGLSLLLGGTALFALFGRALLPSRAGEDSAARGQRELIEAWNLSGTIHELGIPADSPLIGLSREELELEDRYDLHLVALAQGDDARSAPWRHTRFAAGQHLALLGRDEDIHRLIADFGLEARPPHPVFDQLHDPGSVGFAEMVVSPRAEVIGRPIRDFGLRKTWEVEPILLLSRGELHDRDFSDVPLQAGDTVLVHGLFENIQRMDRDPSFVAITEIRAEELAADKRWPAALCFIGALAMAVAGLPLSLSLMTGALAMVLLKVIRIDQAYRAIDWRTVLLVGGLIPLGRAMDQSGAAAWLAELVVGATATAPTFLILLAIAVLTTVFALFMSNVAAAVVLVPLVLAMAPDLGLDPRKLALLVGVAASNSFVLPTHQVNALLIGPGRYRNADYLRAGGAMTLLFLAIAVALTL